jgi:hypothetical protein
MSDYDGTAKKKVIEYYDQEALKYSELYTVERLNQEFYPANSIRLELILDRLTTLGVKSVLDVGCGSRMPRRRRGCAETRRSKASEPHAPSNTPISSLVSTIR